MNLLVSNFLLSTFVLSMSVSASARYFYEKELEANVPLSKAGFEALLPAFENGKVKTRDDVGFDARSRKGRYGRYILGKKPNRVKFRIKLKSHKATIQVNQKLSVFEHKCGDLVIESSMKQFEEKRIPVDLARDVQKTSRSIVNRVKRHHRGLAFQMREYHKSIESLISRFKGDLISSKLQDKDYLFVPVAAYKEKRYWQIKRDFAEGRIEFKLVKIRDLNTKGRLQTRYELEAESENIAGLMNEKKLAAHLCSELNLSELPKHFFFGKSGGGKHYVLKYLNRFYR